MYLIVNGLKLFLGYLKGLFYIPLLSNIFLANLFFIINNFDIANYADDQQYQSNIYPAI